MEDLIFSSGFYTGYGSVDVANIKDFDNALMKFTDEDPKADQPKALEGIQLFPHQQTLLHACMKLENCPREGINTRKLLKTRQAKNQAGVITPASIIFADEEPVILKTSFGCIVDQVGAGKSHVILSMISEKPDLIPYDTIEGSNFQYIMYSREKRFKDHYVHLKSNVLVVPHGTTDQWLKYSSYYTNLSMVVISCNKHIMRYVGTNKLRQKFWNELIEGKYSLIIISNTFYEDFWNFFFNYRTVDRVKELGRRRYTGADFMPISTRLYKEMNPDPTYVPPEPPKKKKTSVTKKPVKGKGKKKSEEPEEEEEEPDESDTYGDEKNFFVEYLKTNVRGIIFHVGCDNYINVIMPYICFNRLIVDEVDTIHWKRSCVIPQSLFLWMTSSSYLQLLFTATTYSYNSTIKGVSKGSPFYPILKNVNSMPHASELFLKNDPEYVKTCLNLPPPINIQIKCKSSVVINALKNDRSMENIIQMIQADDYDGVSDFFGCKIQTPMEVMEAYKKKMGNDIKIKEAEMTLVNLRTYSSKKLKDEALDKIKKEISSLKTRLESLVDNIATMDNDDACGICYDAITKPILLPCCGKVFCSECVFQSLKCGIKKCMYCNGPLEMEKVTLLMTKNDKKKGKEKEGLAKPPEIRTKLMECMYQITSLIEKDPNSKILVFSEYDSSFTQIKDNLKSNKISYDIVHGSSAHITNLIRRMKDGEINVLLLNSRAFGAGLNLEMASDIILYHKMKPSLQTQVIGRAHRFGRVGSLKIHHLLTEEEM